MKTDDWFKPFIAISIIIFLVIFYLYSLNGRYVHVPRFDVLDSRTGIVYNEIYKKLPPEPPAKPDK